jgi:uncharacterized membrane protein YeaQ/YmgE (transglycosylase-associated protein family)
VVGSGVAWFIGSMLGWYGDGSGPGIIMSTLGAILVLIVYRVVFRRKAAPPPTAA